MPYIIRILHCYWTTGHRYGAWEHYDLQDGRRYYKRSCEYCGWIVTQPPLV